MKQLRVRHDKDVDVTSLDAGESATFLTADNADHVLVGEVLVKYGILIAVGDSSVSTPSSVRGPMLTSVLKNRMEKPRAPKLRQ